MIVDGSWMNGLPICAVTVTENNADKMTAEYIILILIFIINPIL
jgi:hypothetical protein